MKEKYYKASVTIETTYISIFIFFSLLFVVYFTLSVYNVSVLTSKTYYILEKHISKDKNEEVQGLLLNDVDKIIEEASILGSGTKMDVRTKFDEIGIDYTFGVSVFDGESGISRQKNGHEIHAVSKRERVRENLFLLKEIKDGVNKLIDN